MKNGGEYLPVRNAVNRLVGKGSRKDSKGLLVVEFHRVACGSSRNDKRLIEELIRGISFVNVERSM